MTLCCRNSCIRVYRVIAFYVLFHIGSSSSLDVGFEPHLNRQILLIRHLLVILFRVFPFPVMHPPPSDHLKQ